MNPKMRINFGTDTVLSRKKSNIVEPILDKITNTYIFEDYRISEKLKQNNINKTVSNNCDKIFRK